MFGARIGKSVGQKNIRILIFVILFPSFGSKDLSRKQNLLGMHPSPKRKRSCVDVKLYRDFKKVVNRVFWCFSAKSHCI